MWSSIVRLFRCFEQNDVRFSNFRILQLQLMQRVPPLSTGCFKTMRNPRLSNFMTIFLVKNLNLKFSKDAKPHRFLFTTTIPPGKLKIFKQIFNFIVEICLIISTSWERLTWLTILGNFSLQNLKKSLRADVKGWEFKSKIFWIKWVGRQTWFILVVDLKMTWKKD